MVHIRGHEGARGFWSRAASKVGRSPVEYETPDYLRAEVLPLALLFSGDFRFRLTCFQRAYAWRTAHVTRLLNNIREAMRASTERKRWYSLGRLMLAQEPGKLEAELVDGHQRLMTLTILFAVLRDLETDPERRDWLHGFIAGGAHHPHGKPVWRLTAQATPALLVEAMVQEMGATELEPDLHPSEMSDTERNIFDNRECLKAELTADGMTAAIRREIADFLATRCYVTTVIADDQDDAWNLIRTEQETRLDFTESDQSKALLLAAMPADDRVTCSRLWEGCEAMLNATDMHRVLLHIRALKWRGRTVSGTPIEADVIKNFGLESGGFAFMEQEFSPHAERLAALRRGAVGDLPKVRDAVASATVHMSLLDLHAWVPAALQWLHIRGENDPETVHFFRRLDRLMWIMKLSGLDPSVQETRLLALLGEIERLDKVDAMTRLAVEPSMIEEAVGSLRSTGFAAKHHAPVVLRRLSLAMGMDSGPVIRGKVTIEHILPRNPPTRGQWRKHFRSKEEIKAHFQRLGNITFLSEPDNQKAGTLDWEEKKPILAGSSFILSRHAAEEREWSVDTVVNRTEQLIKLLFGAWDLDI